MGNFGKLSRRQIMMPKGVYEPNILKNPKKRDKKIFHSIILMTYHIFSRHLRFTSFPSLFFLFSANLLPFQILSSLSSPVLVILWRANNFFLQIFSAFPSPFFFSSSVQRYFHPPWIQIKNSKKNHLHKSPGSIIFVYMCQCPNVSHLLWSATLYAQITEIQNYDQPAASALDRCWRHLCVD